MNDSQWDTLVAGIFKLTQSFVFVLVYRECESWTKILNFLTIEQESNKKKLNLYEWFTDVAINIFRFAKTDHSSVWLFTMNSCNAHSIIGWIEINKNPFFFETIFSWLYSYWPFEYIFYLCINQIFLYQYLHQLCFVCCFLLTLVIFGLIDLFICNYFHNKFL